MVASTLEIGIVILLVTAVIVVGISYLYSYRNKNNIILQTTTRGMNGLGGTKLNLSCPSGQVISFDSYNPVISRGVLFCSNSLQGNNTVPPQNTTNGILLDGFYQQKGQNNSFFNPKSTIDLTAGDSPFSLISSCKGKNSCTFQIPDASDTNIGVLGKCLGSIAMVGTYDCVSPK